MKAEIISIGDELLIGQTINTNASWMGEQLNLSGFEVERITCISDDQKAITGALSLALQTAEIVILTGGLGPTRDDITKHTLCEFFGTGLYRDQEVLARIEQFFQKRNRPMLESNRQQADLPQSATILPNQMGTASGMWFEKDGKIVVSLPGVPYEMKHLMELEVMPRLIQRFNATGIVHRTILTQGIGESFLAELIADWENRLRSSQLSLAYLPSPGIVKLRITGKGNNRKAIEEKINGFEEELLRLIDRYHFGFEKDSLEKILGDLLMSKGKSLSTAESCTGGYIAHCITSVPGSSAYFYGSVISYSNQVKTQELHVPENDLKQFGAVSREVVEQMAKAVRSKLKTDYSVAVSGIAGPDGGTDEKPVGTVWIAVADENKVFSRKYNFEKDRHRNIVRTAQTAMMLLRGFILGKEI